MGETRVAEAERDKSIQVANARKEQSDRHPRGRSASRPCAIADAGKGAGRSASRQAGVRARSAGQRLPSSRCACRWPRPTPRRSTAKTRPQARVAASQAELAIKKAEAYQTGRRPQASRPKPRVLEVQNRAMAKAALAEAERVEAEQRAKLEAPAKAEKAKHDRRCRGRGREAPHRGQGRGRRDLRQARSRGPRPVRDPGQEGRRPASRSSKPAAARRRPSRC